MSEALKTNLEASEAVAEQPTAWDALTESAKTESWEAHLKNAHSLKESESQGSKEKLFMGMKPLQAVENLDKLSEQGVEVDMGALVSMLSAPEQAFYLEELNAHGANLDEENLMQNPDLVAIDEDEGANKTFISNLLSRGSTKIFSELGSKEIINNLDTLLAQDGANIEALTQKMTPNDIMANYELLVSHGASPDKLWIVLSSSTPKTDELISELFRAGVKSEYLVDHMSNTNVIRSFGQLTKQIGDIDYFTNRLDSALVEKELDYLIDNGANPKDIISKLSFDAMLKNFDKLKNAGAVINLDSTKSREEIERDYNLGKANWNLERGNFREARKNLAEGVYEVKLGSLLKELVAFGAYTDINNKLDYTSSGDEESALFLRTPEDIYEKNFSGFGQIHMQNLNDLLEHREINADDALMIAEAAKIISMSDEELKDSISYFTSVRESLNNQKMGDAIRRTREKLCDESAKMYNEYMAKHIDQGVENLEPLLYDYKTSNGETKTQEIPVKRMVGDEWMMFVHVLGGVIAKSEEAIANPETWDKINPMYYDSDKRPVGYVSTTAIGDQCLQTAGSDGTITKNPLIYCFSQLPENTFKYSAGYDLMTSESDKGIAVGRQDFFYTNPRTIVNHTRNMIADGEATELRNETVLNRYPGGDATPESRLHPNYLAVFSGNPSDIQDITKKHAAYFGVPIMLIDPKKYGRSKNESITNTQ